MTNRTLLVPLSLSLLARRPVALQLQAPHGVVISIAGHAKCGTSHLYKLLASHRNVFSLRKELCPDAPYVDMDEGLFAKYLDFTASRTHAADGSWSSMELQEVLKACLDKFPSSSDKCQSFYNGAVSGRSENATRVLQSCIHAESVTRMQNLLLVANTMVLYLQRDPADIWQNQMDAPHTVMNKDWKSPWTNEMSFRSPEHFHELVRSEGRLAGGVADWSSYLMITEMHQLRDAFSKRRVLFLRSEDMHLRDTVQKVCDFVGLDIDGLDPELIGTRTNVQGALDDRGIGSTAGGEQPGRYEVSHFEPMLCKTRKLIIYSQASHQCQLLEKDFGLRYQECLGAGASTTCLDGS